MPNRVQTRAPATRGSQAALILAAALLKGAPESALLNGRSRRPLDNLYFVGMTEYAAWAIATSESIIILLDAIFDYSR